MKLDKVLSYVEGIPVMTYEQAGVMTDFILTHQPTSILELGFRHGVSTCYMAAALDELGRGRITTIDLERARSLDPTIEQLLQKAGLARYVQIYYEPSSYLWRLMKMLDENTSPPFDLCYIDGAHSWATDGFAFFLVDRLLKPGGWIIFDDLDWTFAGSMPDHEIVRKMPAEERTTAQVRKIYELLVKPHPDYGNFMIRDQWAFAQKIRGTEVDRADVKKETVVITQRVGVGSYLQFYTKKIARLVSRLLSGRKNYGTRH